MLSGSSFLFMKDDSDCSDFRKAEIDKKQD